MWEKNVGKRILQLVIGTLIISMGISFQLKAAIGVSPISSLPYVVSLCTPLTVGTWITIWNALFTLFEACVLRQRFRKLYLLQIPLAFLIGYGTDFTNYLISWLPVPSYAVRLFYSVLGIFIMALGILLTVSANLIMNGPEAFQHAIASTWHFEFGYVRVVSDVSMILLACVVSFLLYHKIEGVREGTILSAIFTGLVVKLYKNIGQKWKNSHLEA